MTETETSEPAREDSSQFGAGLLTGFTVSALLVGGLRAAQWAETTDVVRAAIVWFTTPSIAPADLVPIVLLVLIAFMAWLAMGIMPRGL